MPVLIALLALLGGAAFWYYRIRDVGRIAAGTVDAAQRIRGAYRRKRFRTKAENSPFAAVDDPVAAAAAMLVALAAPDGRLGEGAEAVIRNEMRRVIGPPNLDEVFTFGRWLAGQTADPNDVSLKMSKLWMTALTPSERFDLYGMASRVVAASGEVTDLQRDALARLKARLGLTKS